MTEETKEIKLIVEKLLRQATTAHLLLIGELGEKIIALEQRVKALEEKLVIEHNYPHKELIK
jgi:hypothetical protein